MKKFLSALFSLCLVFALVACGSSGGGEASGGESEETFLSIGTGGTGGAWYAIMSAAGAALNSDLNLDVQATGGSIENMKLVTNQSADLGFASPDTAYFAYEGGREFDNANPDLRVVMAGNMMYEYIIVRADSDIHEMEDINGKTVSIGAPGSATDIVGNEVLSSLGVEPAETINLAHSEAATALQEGTVDVMMALSGVPFTAATELSTVEDVRFIPLNQNEIDTVVENNQYWSGGELPAETYEGQNQPIPGINVGSLVIADESASEDDIYNLLNTLLVENHDEWEKGHNLASDFTIEMMETYVENGVVLLPFHPGAEKFFEEQGVTLNK
ncbi:TAXI family TRAP transporter solute-binding subunit [Alteribacillus iranensis]|uniref:TRAP transporter solute receptor, TAXI family n=1 Tax=Alteribacillus iranensis TaxID=930128 RepID=A0A1I2B8L9_9BACI|nr:TAXI family TRAP transporter solute-binding subunit [Alteribacillus iranensis]SFE52552.1 hypothetical protein SAMN05192532_102155 [Alteribacillus iranensis]